MGRTNHSYNGMLSAIARKSLPRFTNYAKDTASLSTIFGNEYSTINKRGNDSLTNIISADFDTPEEYIKETNVGPIITLNGDRTVTMTAGEDYTDLGATADGDEEVTVDTSNLDTTVVGTYTVSYSATDTEGYTRVENRFVKVVAPEEWTPGYTTVPVTLGDKLHLNVSSLTLGQKYVFDFSQTRGKDFRLSNDGTTELTDGVIEAENTLVYTVPSDFNSPLYYYSPNTPNIGGYFRVNNVVYSDQGILKIGGITSIIRGQTYTFYFSSDFGTTIALTITEDGTDFTEDVTTTPTSLTFIVPTKYSPNAIYIKSPTTSGIGSSLTVSGTLDDGVIYFDNGILKATGITSIIRGQTYTFYFSSDFGTTIALSTTEDGTDFTEDVTTTPTSLTFVVPETYGKNIIYIKSPTTTGIGSSLTVSGAVTPNHVYFDATGNLQISGVNSIGRGHTYRFYFSSDYGTEILLALTEDGTTFTQGVTTEATSLTFSVPSTYAQNNIYIKSPTTTGIGSSLSVKDLQITETKLLASDGTTSDRFGDSVSISRDGLTAIVGAPYCNDNNNVTTGAAYIFKYANGSWSENTKLLANVRAEDDRFGFSVSISDDGLTAIVGAPYYDGNSVNTGAAYIFKYANGLWSETRLLSQYYFGWSVSISGDGLTAIVAATFPGSVYVFNYANGSWSQSTELKENGVASFQFGSSVSISRDGLTVIVGHPANNDNGTNSGSAYIFKYANGEWSQTKLLANDIAADDQFGSSVSISDDGLTAIVGAWFDDYDVNGYVNSGAAYIFNYANGTWSQTKLLADYPTQYDYFGSSVSISGDGLTAIVGAYFDDDQGSASGSAFIFKYDNGAWSLTKLLASDGTTSDRFGDSVSISRDGLTAIVGATQNDDNGTDSGSAYIYNYL